MSALRGHDSLSGAPVIIVNTTMRSCRTDIARTTGFDEGDGVGGFVDVRSQLLHVIEPLLFEQIEVLDRRRVVRVRQHNACGLDYLWRHVRHLENTNTP